MKTIKNIKEKVTSFENLYTAYLHARRNKRFRKEVLDFSANLEDNLHDLQTALREQTYVPGEYKKKIIHDPVDRLIMWQEFIHRVVQWAVYQVINPEFVRGYIEDSYACIKGRGSDAAAKRLFYFMQQLARENPGAYLGKADTSKFFYRIDHAVSLELVGRKCGFDPWLMWLMDLFVNAPGEKFGFPPGKGVGEVSPEEMLADKGLAVGSLLNQMLANVNQNVVDHYAKRVLRIRYYVRYMDDIVILGDSKEQVHLTSQAEDTEASEESTPPEEEETPDPVSSQPEPEPEDPAPIQTSATTSSYDGFDLKNLYPAFIWENFQPIEEDSSSDDTQEWVYETEWEDEYEEPALGTLLEDDALEVIRLTNLERENHGLNSLEIDDDLMALAEIRAEEASTKYSHERPDGTRVSQMGYYGENLGAKASAEKQVASWMDSEGHRANILREGYHKIGVGCYLAANGKHYWIQVFSK